MLSRICIVIVCFCLLVGASACGNKGPLTLPEEEDEKAKNKSE